MTAANTGPTAVIRCTDDRHAVTFTVDDGVIHAGTVHDTHDALDALAGEPPTHPCARLARIWDGITGAHDPERLHRAASSIRSSGRAALNTYVTGRPYWPADVAYWRSVGVDDLDHLRHLCQWADDIARPRGTSAKPRQAEIREALTDLGYRAPAKPPRP